jgi:hypothetical protein
MQWIQNSEEKIQSWELQSHLNNGCNPEVGSNYSKKGDKKPPSLELIQ